MGIISWKVNGMKREKKKGKKTKYFTGFTEALFTYQNFFGPELLFVSERMKTAFVFLIRLTCCEQGS